MGRNFENLQELKVKMGGLRWDTHKDRCAVTAPSVAREASDGIQEDEMVAGDKDAKLKAAMAANPPARPEGEHHH